MQMVRRTLPLSQEVQSGPPCFLNSLWSPGVAKSNLSLRLEQQFMSNRIIYTMFIIILSSYTD